MIMTTDEQAMENIEKKKTVVNMCLELDECFCQMADIFKSSLKTSGSHWDWTGHVIG